MELGRYSITSDYDSISGLRSRSLQVPTPLRDGLPDLSFIEGAARSLAGHISSGATIILESTTYPGTTEELLVPILEQGSGLKAGKDFLRRLQPRTNRPW